MSKYENYLYDLGFELKNMALEARRERDAALPDSAERQFHSGRTLAYYEVISTMQGLSEGFEILLSELRLDDIKPDRDLT